MTNLVEEPSMDQGHYIENSIIKFVDILRHMGLRVSSAEVIDAVRALEMVDIMDKSQVETVFASTLAKNETDQKLIKNAFSSFFTTPEEAEKRLKKYMEAEEKKAAEVQAAEEELSFEWEEMGEDGEHSGELKLDLTDEEKQIYTQMPEDKKQKIRDYLKNQFQGNRINSPEKLINNMVRGSINYWKCRLRKDEKNIPYDIQYTGEAETDSLLDEVAEKTMDEEDLMYEDMQKLADQDLPQVGLLIRKMSRKLAVRISRRYKQSKKRQRLDLRKSIRDNVRYGGTLFKLDFKTKKIQKPRFLLICDVSGSMAKYAGFVLQFIYGLASSVDDIESFVFSEGVERVTPHLRGRQSFDEIMTDLINKSEEWGKGTELSKALRVIEQEHKGLIKSNAFVIIVSDTMTQNFREAAEQVAKLRKDVKDIIWLNTLPKREWDDTPSVDAFYKVCTMFECNTLSDLEKIMTNRVLRY